MLGSLFIVLASCLVPGRGFAQATATQLTPSMLAPVDTSTAWTEQVLGWSAAEVAKALDPASALSMAPVVRQAPSCSTDQLNVIFSPATAGSPRVNLNCSLKLDSSAHVITRQLYLEGSASSNVVVDCNGSTIDPTFAERAIQIQSVLNADGTWDRPAHVTVRNCNLTHGILVQGMKPDGGGPETRLSSQHAGHTERAQAAAPTDILLEGCRSRRSAASSRSTSGAGSPI